MMTKLSLLVGLTASVLVAACAEPSTRPTPDTASVAPRTDAPAVTPQDVTPPSPPPAAPPAGNGASVDPDVRQRVLVLLGGIEHIPSREEFARAGSDDQVVAVLGSLSRDGSAKLRQRAGAAAALGLYPRPDTRAALEQLVQDPATEELVRRPSIKAYATAFGPDAVPLVRTMLDRSDRSTRETAVRALAGIGSPAARQAVSDHLKVETDASLRQVTEDTLARWK